MLKSAFAQHLQGGVVWLPEKVKIVEMPGNRTEDGYGEIRRVRIAKMAGIPIDCDFAAKEIKGGNPPPPMTGPKYGGMCESNPASRHDKVLGSSPQNNGIIHIVVEWRFISFVLAEAEFQSVRSDYFGKYKIY